MLAACSSQRAAAAPQAEAPAPAEAFDAAAATSAAKRMKVEELRAALEAVGAATEGNKPTLVERLVKAQSGDAMEDDDEAAPEPPKEAAYWGRSDGPGGDSGGPGGG